MATLNAKWDSAKQLIESGALLDKWDFYGRNPLYGAVDYSTIPHGGRPDRLSGDLTTPLEIIEMILERGGNPNLQLKLFPPYRALGADRGADGLLRTGVTAAFSCSSRRRYSRHEILAEHGALVDLPQENDVTPLIVAAGYRASAIDTRGRFRNEEESFAATSLLLEYGADVNAREDFGQTAIFGAATMAGTVSCNCLLITVLIYLLKILMEILYLMPLWGRLEGLVVVPAGMFIWKQQH